MGEILQIEQALFGYKEGHNLLAASIELAPRTRQFLANATDGSGPENPEGFEATYTGLPVPETNYYALFCTWPAPEMSRPGCVWSHVLLVDLADLARIPDLGILRKYCQRPSSWPDFPTYEKQIPFRAPEGFSGLARPDEQNATLLLVALYGQPQNGIVILDGSSKPWEATIFAIWSQQWPRLRRNFSFSTGSFGDRRNAGLSFDLQVAPLSSQRLWRRSEFPTTVLSPNEKSFTFSIPRWAEVALDDLRDGSTGLLRKFLFTYGSEIEAPRVAFHRLAECFLGSSSDEDDDSNARLANLATGFPDPAEALSLKRDWLAAAAGGRAESDHASFWATAYFLLLAQNAEAFSRVPLDFSAHSAFLWQHKRADVLALLGKLPESPRANEFIHALVTVLSPDDVPTLWHEQPAALTRLLSKRPDLAAGPVAWAMPEAGQRALWSSLRTATTDPLIWARVCGAMLQAQCTVAEQETVDLAAASLAVGLLAWLKDRHLHLPSSTWRKALRGPLSDMLNEGSMPIPLLAFTAWLLSPSKALSLSGQRSDIQQFTQDDMSAIPEPLILPTMFWLTAIGLQTSGQDGLALLSHAFFRVYDAVAHSNYPGEAWDRLATVLPDTTFGLDWDRCSRLRKALRKWLKNQHNPSFSDTLRHAAPTPEYANLVQNLR